jgi:nitronate monooxygenase
MNAPVLPAAAQAFVSRLGIDHPIVQAPMAGGATTPELVAAVCEAGALGSLAGAMLAPQKILDDAAAIRQRTGKPFNVNLFVLPDPPELDAPLRAHMERTAQLLAPLRRDLGLPEVDLPTKFSERFVDQLAAVREVAPAVASFHFNIPPRSEIKALQAAGSLVLGSATNVAEALAWQEAGVDLIVAQGAEAGGHRGTFIGSTEESLIGIMALVPQIAAAVRIPVIAAGGIMDGRGVRAALGLGAAAAQLGTAFLSCPEAGIPDIYKQALQSEAARRTVITRSVSGRPARAIVNAYVERMHPHQHELPGYPVMNAMTGGLRAAAAKAGRADYMSLWAGQNAALSRTLPAAELVARLIGELAGEPAEKPAGSPIIPCLRYRDAPAAIDWLCRAFGFEKHLVVPGEDDTVAHAQLRLGQGMIMLGSATQGEWGRLICQPDQIKGCETQAPYIVVPDADAHYARAKAAGAEMLLDIKSEDYGGRGYTCRDLEGHVWTFGTFDPWA